MDGITNFFAEMNKIVPPGAHIMAIQVPGDPYAARGAAWKAFPLTNPKQLDPNYNIFLAVSAMKKDSRGELRRKKENFAGGLLLMIDDLGEGAGSKFPLSTIDRLAPSALIETSRNNFQAVFFLTKSKKAA